MTQDPINVDPKHYKVEMENDRRALIGFCREWRSCQVRRAVANAPSSRLARPNATNRLTGKRSRRA